MLNSNRLLRCPKCGGRLGGDKNPYISEWGIAFRKRFCQACGVTVYSKQQSETITEIEIYGLPENPAFAEKVQGG